MKRIKIVLVNTKICYIAEPLNNIFNTQIPNLQLQRLTSVQLLQSDSEMCGVAIHQAVLDHLTGIGERLMETEVQLFQKGVSFCVVVCTCVMAGYIHAFS